MKLFEAGQIGRMEVKNRIVMAPMGIRGMVEPDGRLSPKALDIKKKPVPSSLRNILTLLSWEYWLSGMKRRS